MIETSTDTAQIRVWIYRSLKKLTSEQENDIARRAGEFVSQWAAHGKPLAADFDILYGHYLIFFVDQSWEKNSGCSIDASVALIREIEAEYHLGLLDRLQIGFLSGEEVHFHDFRQFDSLYKQGVISASDQVINPMVQNKKEFDEGFVSRFENSPFMPGK